MKQSWRQASMQVSNSSVARPWKLEQNPSGQASRQASRAASRASSQWKLKQNNLTKKGPFFGPQNVRKSRRAKMASPVQVSTRSCCWSNQLQLEINASTYLLQWRGQNWTLQGGPLVISRGSTFWPLFKTRFLCTGVQSWTSTFCQNWRILSKRTASARRSGRTFCHLVVQTWLFIVFFVYSSKKRLRGLNPGVPAADSWNKGESEIKGWEWLGSAGPLRRFKVRLLFLMLWGPKTGPFFFFPSDASWLSPGRSTRSIACCSDEWIS